MKAQHCHLASGRSLCNSFYHISLLVRMLGLANLVGHVLLYGALKFKVGFVAKLFRDFLPSVLNFYSK